MVASEINVLSQEFAKMGGRLQQLEQAASEFSRRRWRNPASAGRKPGPELFRRNPRALARRRWVGLDAYLRYSALTVPMIKARGGTLL